MRRKLFLFTIIIIFSLAVMDYAEIPLSDFHAENLPKGLAEYEGKVVGIARWDEEKISVKVRIDRAGGKKTRWKNCILLSCYEEKAKPWELWKSRVGFECEAQLASAARNPRCFDYNKYLLSEGISAVGYTDRLSFVKEASSAPDLVQKGLVKAKYDFAESLSEKPRGVIMGMVFGDTSFLDEDIYEAFRNNGTAHVLAVSGLHVGILYRWFRKLAGKRQSALSFIVTAVFLLTYCFLSSFCISSMRASVMIMLSVWASYSDRRYDTVTAAAAAALMFIAANPYVIFSVSFQMSFLAVCSIAFFSKRMPAKVPDGAAVMLAANIGLCPYQIYVFNWLSLSSFIANIPVVYLAGITVPLGMLHFAAYSLIGDVKALSIAEEILSNAIIEINGFLSFGGAGGLDMTSPPLWLIIFIYFAMFFLASEQFEIMRLRREKAKIAALICVFALFSLFIRTADYKPITDSDLIFVDVGQGDCTHIREGDTNILIDGGGKINYNVGEKTLKPYLLKNGVRNVDLAIATHLHTDHYKGLKELEDEDMIRELKTRLTAGSTFRASEDVVVETLWPISLEDDLSQDENENCSVFMIYFKGARILVTGDLEGNGEREMAEFYRNSGKLRADILKIGHHGSKTSTTDELLSAVRPEYAVIQVGKNNYGHPDAKIIEKCRQRGIMVLRNDTHGAVGFSFKEGKIRHYEMIEAG